jgi:phage-related protein
MVSKADRINTSWKQLELTYKGTGVSMDNLKEQTNNLQQQTGRSGTQVRDFFNQMGIAGITNTDLLSTAFTNMAGRAYQTGSSIESMEGFVQKMVMSGNAGAKMLSNLGISSTALADAMGVTKEEAAATFKELSESERLEVLNKAMGDGKEANEAYKNSYAGLKEQATNAIGGLMAAVGQGILPVVNPMIRGATGLIKNFTSSFKSLPGPVQGVVGSLGGFLAIGTAAIGTLGLIGQVGSGVVGGLRSMKSGYDSVKSAIGTARDALNALRNAESITEGVRAALAVATGAEATAEGAGAAAKGAAVAPTTALATAENSLLWPLLLIVGAVVAVIAVMWYLYNTNETVRNGINWLIAQIQAFVAGLMPVVQAIINFVTQGAANMNRLPGLIWNALTAVITAVAQWATNFIQRGISAATNFVNSIGSALSSIGGVIQGALSNVYSFMTAPFQQAFDFINNTIIQPLKSAWDWLSSAFSGFEGLDPKDAHQGYSGLDTLNGTISAISSNSSSNSTVINNTFNGLVEESAADYIVNAVNDRLRREKLLKGA